MKGSRCIQILIGGCAVGAIALGIGWFNRNTLLETTLEQNLSTLTGVRTDIDKVNVQPFEGSLTIQTLTLSNPKGFSSPYLLVLDRLELQLEPNTFFQDIVEVQTLEVDGLEVNLEQQLNQNNLAAVVHTLEQQAGGNGRHSDGNNKAVNIEHLEIRDIEATLTLSVISSIGLNQKLDFPDIRLTDLTPQSTHGKLTTAVTMAITTAIFNELSEHHRLDVNLP